MHVDFANERAAKEELQQSWELAKQHSTLVQDQLKAEIYHLRQGLVTSDLSGHLREEER